MLDGIKSNTVSLRGAEALFSPARLQHLWRTLSAAGEVNPAAYRHQVASLFTSPTALLPEGVAGILTPIFCQYATGLAVFGYMAGLTAVAMALRILLILRYRSRDRERQPLADIRRWDRNSFIGATAFSLLVGVNTWLALTHTEVAAAHVAVVIAAVALSSGALVRNVGRPLFVTLHLLGYGAPLAAGLLSSELGLYLPLGGLVAFFLANNLAVTLVVHRDLLDLGRARGTSEDLGHQIRKQNVTLDAALNHMNHGLAMFDRSLALAVCNKRFRELYRLPEHLAQPGTPLSEIERFLVEADILSSDHAGELSLCCQRVLRIQQESQCEITTSQGRALVVSVGSVPDGSVIVHTEDATERKHTEAKIERMARFDELTGLANRFEFGAALKKACRRLSQTSQPFAVMYVDLDNFKQVNDRLGHNSGDKVLVEMARRLLASSSYGDVVARFGGDEFVLIHFGLSEEDASSAAQAIVAALAMPIDADGRTVHITASIGLALAPAHGTKPADLLRHADMALYHAKEVGRRTAVLFSPDMALAVSERHELESHLRQASETRSLALHYQPIVDIATRKVVAFEALMRWPHPLRGIVSPGVFIPIAEEIGLIGNLGDWAIRQACIDASDWPTEIGVSVNVSPLQFRYPTRLIETVKDALRVSGIAPSRLSLEVTESLLIEDQEVTLNAIHELRRIGVRLSLDDFGTGYSSLGYLATYPFSQVKIDQSFAAEVTSDPNSQYIIQAVCELARRLNMRIVVEGIETEEQLQAIRALGAERAQGFLFGQAAPLEAIAMTLRKAA